MPRPMVEEAARLLECEPTRALDAHTLYLRARHGACTDETLATFIESLRALPHRFTIVATTYGSIPDEGWDERDRVRYRHALDDAGLGSSMIALADEPHTLFGAAPQPRGNAALLRDVHDAVSTLARAEGSDHAALHELAARALEQLQVVTRALPR
jgi:hypothetical protein